MTTQVICCTCLEQPTPEIDYYSLDSDPSAANELSLKEKLLLCIPEFEDVLSDNEENSWICRICCEALSWSYNFRKMCLEVKKKLGKSRNNVGVRIKEEAIDIDEMIISVKDNEAVLKTETPSDESSKINSFVDIEETFGGEEIEREVLTEEDPLADSLFVIASEEAIIKDANAKVGKRKKNVSLFRQSNNIRHQKEASRRKQESDMNHGKTQADVKLKKKVSVFRPSKNIRRQRQTSSIRKETDMNNRNTKVDLKLKKKVSVFRPSKNIRHQRKTSRTRKETEQTLEIVKSNLNDTLEEQKTDKNTLKMNNQSQANSESNIQIDYSLLIERACKTIPVLKAKNVSPKRFKCFVKMAVLGNNQYYIPTISSTKVQHLEEQTSLNPTSQTSLESPPSTKETEECDDDDDDIDPDWEELNLHLSDTEVTATSSPVLITDDDDGTQESWKHRIRDRSKKIEQKPIDDEWLNDDENENHLKKKSKIYDKTYSLKGKFEAELRRAPRKTKNRKAKRETPKPENDIGKCAIFVKVADELKKYDTVFRTVICPTCKNLFNNKYYDKAHKYICEKTLKDFEETKVTHQCGMCNEVFDDLDTLNSHCVAHGYEKSVVNQQMSLRDCEKCDMFYDLSERHCV